MPTYVYECRTCAKSFEAEQSIKDAPLTDCECGGVVRRVIQPVGIAFKGSGFYVNDSVAKPAEKKTEATPATPVAETPSTDTTPPAVSAPATTPIESPAKADPAS